LGLVIYKYRLDNELNSRISQYSLNNYIGRVLTASPNSNYNQRLETYYFQSAAARSSKTLVAKFEIHASGLGDI